MPTESSSWTHPSVLAIAHGEDPLEVITEKARDIVSKAYDKEWSGPPFDPFKLASLLGIRTFPRNDVRDARIVSVSNRGFRIDYNPSRPRARLRYSVAHEIAHTLFPDCAEKIRHRSHPEDSTSQTWQIESLCNLAAAEFLMPLGSFSSLRSGSLEIERMRELRQEFAVSMEAVLLRTARLTDAPCMVFVASRPEEPELDTRYHLDYSVASAGWKQSSPRPGTRLPESSCVFQCTKIGFTAKQEEKWIAGSRCHSVECIALPPHPRSVYPRVAGIVKVLDEISLTETIKYIRGDATEPREYPAMIVQVVNDKTPNWGGNGFAVAVRRKWPFVQRSFREYASTQRLKLGEVKVVQAAPDVWVASVVAQRGYGPSPKPRIRYAALRSALIEVACTAKQLGATLHMPRIGCGEGQGNWDLIGDIVRSACVPRDLCVYVYDLPNTPFSNTLDGLPLFATKQSI